MYPKPESFVVVERIARIPDLADMSHTRFPPVYLEKKFILNAGDNVPECASGTLSAFARKEGHTML